MRGDVPGDVTAYRVDELERRLEQLEALQPGITAERLKHLAERVDTLMKIAITLLITTFGAGVSFVVMAVSRLGGGG